MTCIMFSVGYAPPPPIYVPVKDPSPQMLGTQHFSNNSNLMYRTAAFTNNIQLLT